MSSEKVESQNRHQYHRLTDKRRSMIRPVILGIATLLLLGLLYGALVYWLWNLIIPELFSLRPINFWQAVGLVVLSHILFKSNPLERHRNPGHRHWRERLHRALGDED